MFLAGIGYILGQVNLPQSVLCVLASQIANFGESLIGATLQDKEGFEWVSLNFQMLNADALYTMLLRDRLFFSIEALWIIRIGSPNFYGTHSYTLHSIGITA
uniref:Uncharacterized protein n=1 Tax=Aegilops tauschii subsp. strangulata TaxID=200361 RepID=A0A453FGR9_AEGTS